MGTFPVCYLQKYKEIAHWVAPLMPCMFLGVSYLRLLCRSCSSTWQQSRRPRSSCACARFTGNSSRSVPATAQTCTPAPVKFTQFFCAAANTRCGRAQGVPGCICAPCGPVLQALAHLVFCACLQRKLAIKLSQKHQLMEVHRLPAPCAPRTRAHALLKLHVLLLQKLDFTLSTVSMT